MSRELNTPSIFIHCMSIEILISTVVKQLKSKIVIATHNTYILNVNYAVFKYLINCVDDGQIQYVS